jgi:glycosyltransferase involved in cell wall biosynthesis
MKVMYISSTHSGMHQSSIYFDLMKEFVDNGHDVTIVYAREKRLNQETDLYEANGMRYLGIKTGNISKNKNVIEKGIATLTIDGMFVKGIKEYLSSESFDLVLYSTPPITFIKTLKYIRKISPNVFIYLMLKDIFPQNAVDIGMMSNKGLLYKMFRNKEKTLYSLVDYVGVMSEANRQYILKQDPELKGRVEILPNAISLRDESVEFKRSDFGIPDDKLVLLYGGNLGKPQDIGFVVDCARALEAVEDVYFVIAGSGGQQGLIEAYINQDSPRNFKYLGQLETDKYNALTNLCDVGLIFLDYRFKIPNYPQRLLSYLAVKKPVLCATDSSTDIGTMAVENGYGLAVSSNDVAAWIDAVKYFISNRDAVIEMGNLGYQYMCENFTVDKAYEIIMNRVSGV